MCIAVEIDMREIDYKRLPGITHEQELELLANVYHLALESYRKKRAARPSGPDAAPSSEAHEVSPAADKKSLQLVHDEGGDYVDRPD